MYSVCGGGYIPCGLSSQHCMYVRCPSCPSGRCLCIRSTINFHAFWTGCATATTDIRPFPLPVVGTKPRRSLGFFLGIWLLAQESYSDRSQLTWLVYGHTESQRSDRIGRAFTFSYDSCPSGAALGYALPRTTWRTRCSTIVPGQASPRPALRSCVDSGVLVSVGRREFDRGLC